MEEVRVTPASSGDLEPFVDLGPALRAGDADYSAPFRAAALAELQAGPGPGGALQPFLAVRGTAPVGRVAALLHPALQEAPGRPLGQVGYYECADDPAAAAALLEAACGWLRARGVRRAVGPMNGGAHRAGLLLTDGFDTSPHLLEPRTPRRYLAHFEAAGFVPVSRWTAHEPSLAQVEALAASQRRIAGRALVRIEPLDARDPATVLPRLHRLLDRAWAGYPGYVPFPFEEFARAFGGLLAILPPGHVAVVVDGAGQDLGLGYMLPDWFEEVRALRGDPAGWGRWLAEPLPDRVVLHSVAVVPEARRGAAAAALVARGCEVALQAGYRRFLVARTREDFRAHVRRLPATRRYALLGRAL
jgi:GNAT superfamily N-acetyltransferase